MRSLSRRPPVATRLSMPRQYSGAVSRLEAAQHRRAATGAVARAAPAALPKSFVARRPLPWAEPTRYHSGAAAGVGHYFANANCDPITMLVLFNSKNPARVYPMTEMMALPARVLTGGCGRHCCQAHCGAGRCLRWWLQRG